MHGLISTKFLDFFYSAENYSQLSRLYHDSELHNSIFFNHVLALHENFTLRYIPAAFWYLFVHFYFFFSGYSNDNGRPTSGSYDSLDDPSTQKSRGMEITSAQVAFESQSRHYTLVDFDAHADTVKVSFEQIVFSSMVNGLFIDSYF